ncbi:Pectinesterase QRT1 [Striga hermonthica]|uniref:pectinesterase n=1 Tax=Striga hermonthica TaxID=68872 RepID=A0A9N7N7J2_STRHE|nr:Pectinesterase QRT1 [Striga hermonthica]
MDITVNQDGNGDFKTINDAISSIPILNTQRILIHINSGIYREKVNIPRSMHFITLIGNEFEPPTITGNDTASTVIGKDGKKLRTFQSATVAIDADYFMAINLKFEDREALYGATFHRSRPSTKFKQASAFSNHGLGSLIFPWLGRFFLSMGPYAILVLSIYVDIPFDPPSDTRVPHLIDEAEGVFTWDELQRFGDSRPNDPFDLDDVPSISDVPDSISGHGASLVCTDMGDPHPVESGDHGPHPVGSGDHSPHSGTAARSGSRSASSSGLLRAASMFARNKQWAL